MKILLTLDYELFLGEKTGSVTSCLINPMKRLLQEVAPVNAKFTLFVDASYLLMLYKLKETQVTLKKDYGIICKHLLQLKDEGHDIQLHIHPQWFFSEYNGNEWVMDTKHYKLCDVKREDLISLFVDSKNLLDELIGKQTKAFRAGGFSAQPTELLNTLFENSGIIIDSSVCPGTSYNSDYQKYDYVNVPNTCLYHFSNDICQNNVDGVFTEIPISMIQVRPVFHWKLAMTKMAVKVGCGKKYKRMGDGLSVKTAGGNIFTRMVRTTKTMATIDEYKSSLLVNAYINAKKRGNDYFCVLGHPKLSTPYSLKKVGEFCKYVKIDGGEFVTMSDVI